MVIMKCSLGESPEVIILPWHMKQVSVEAAPTNATLITYHSIAKHGYFVQACQIMRNIAICA